MYSSATSEDFHHFLVTLNTEAMNEGKTLEPVFVVDENLDAPHQPALAPRSGVNQISAPGCGGGGGKGKTPAQRMLECHVPERVAQAATTEAGVDKVPGGWKNDGSG